jgi:hypothetical protein
VSYRWATLGWTWSNILKNSSVEILFGRCAFLSARKTMHCAAHHFLQTLYSIENALHSCIEFCTFNPFVVGSTPAGPTKNQKSTLYFGTKCFFLGCSLTNAPTQVQVHFLV